MAFLMQSDANPAPTHKFPATYERAQEFEHCELVTAEAAADYRNVNERCTGPVGVKVNTALPAAVQSVRVLRGCQGPVGLERDQLLPV